MLSGGGRLVRMSSRRASPTVPTRRVAATLRTFREQAGMTIGDAARDLGHDGSWLSRIEGRENRASVGDVIALMRLYGAKDPVIDAVAAVAKQARQRGWWQRYGKTVPDWFGQYLGLESDASAIREYDCQSVPGLLQTEDYARAAIRSAAGAPARADEVEQFVRLRIDRQEILDSDDPPQVRAVLDEAVLQREVGGPQVLREQIDHLVDLVARRPAVQVQILPNRAGAHAGMNGSFVLLDFPPPAAPYPAAAVDDRIAYVDMRLGARYFDEPGDVAAYSETFEQIRAEALPPDESVDLMRTMAKHLASR
jgi:hypothetical protein